MRRTDTKNSKFLSLVLRHKPDLIGLSLDQEGWAVIDELIEKSRRVYRHLTLMEIQNIVSTSDKQRFAISRDGKHIRAEHGHSVPVDLDLPESVPPETLYHGTTLRNLSSIRQKGIHSGNRIYVHLSDDELKASLVGSRHGKPVVILVQAGRMYRDGHRFMCSKSGVWLTEGVPPNYLQFVETEFNNR